jgi:hypothetical protein
MGASGIIVVVLLLLLIKIAGAKAPEFDETYEPRWRVIKKWLIPFYKDKKDV